MPRQRIDYANTCFYKIVCKDLNHKELYIGHTTDFSKRKAEHKKTCLKSYSHRHNLKVYQYIRDNGGWDNFDMILIERIPCADKLEACKIERRYIEQHQASLNVYIPTRTKQEYYQDTREHTLERVKHYYTENKEKVDEWRNVEYSCDCGGSYHNHNKARHMKSMKHQEYLQSLED